MFIDWTFRQWYYSNGLLGRLFTFYYFDILVWQISLALSVQRRFEAG